MKPNHHEAADLQISRRISKIWHPFKGSKEGFRQVGSVAKGDGDGDGDDDGGLNAFTQNVSTLN